MGGRQGLTASPVRAIAKSALEHTPARDELRELGELLGRRPRWDWRRGSGGSEAGV